MGKPEFRAIDMDIFERSFRNTSQGIMPYKDKFTLLGNLIKSLPGEKIFFLTIAC